MVTGRVLSASAVVAVLTMAGPASAQPPAQMTAAVGGNMNHVPSFVGVEKGIFLKHGLDLKLKVLNTGQEMAKALQAGEAQIIGSAYSNFPVAVERGMGARGVVGLMGDRTSRYSDDPISIWTRKGTGITKVEDLAGRKIGTPVGGTADEYLGVVLKRKGLSREKVNLLNVPPGNLVSALQGGGVDAVACWEPFGSLVQARVPEAVLVSRGGGTSATTSTWPSATTSSTRAPSWWNATSSPWPKRPSTRGSISTTRRRSPPAGSRAWTEPSPSRPSAT